MSDFTILIQGPSNKIGISAAPNYSEYGEVVLSTWVEGDLPPVKDRTFVIEALSRETGLWELTVHVRGTVQPLPDRSNIRGGMKDSTFYWAICSMYNGLSLVNTEYVIKTRSDERYTNLQPFIDRILESPHKFVCGNIFFKPWSFRPYHIGDHIFVAKTEQLRKAVGILKDMYEGTIPLEPWANESPLGAEVALARAWLVANKIPQETWTNYDTFLSNFDVVDIAETGAFIATWVHGGKTYGLGDEFPTLDESCPDLSWM